MSKNPHAVALGRMGGKKGGKAKVPKGFARLTPEQRSEIARKGGKASRQAKPASSPVIPES